MIKALYDNTEDLALCNVIVFIQLLDRVFSLSRMTTNNLISPMKIFYYTLSPKDLDPSYKWDVDFWDCFRREKTLS